jgi:hypothetical protein
MALNVKGKNFIIYVLNLLEKKIQGMTKFWEILKILKNKIIF